MTQRVATYARYSSDLQRDSSIEDQIRICNEKAEKEGWLIVNCYTDAGISGASLLRPGIQALIKDALEGEFDIVLCEAMDRLSRDQEDIAGFYKRMEFAGIKIVTLSEGEVNAMHIGLKGTMNAMFLKDLADKTRRGIRGCIENGRSGGGISYGYKVVKQFAANGEVIRGHREINEDQAQVICRIFKNYANDNFSPKAIAAQLNKEEVLAPNGGQWAQSTINGNRKRGTGILNNELYIGQRVWNRQRFIKNPSTGRRVTRMNDESEWVRKDVPELRIVPPALWEGAKNRQKKLDHLGGKFNRKKRPRYLLSGLLECGECGGRYTKVNDTRYGCAISRNRGESGCRNRKTIKRETLENVVIDALQTHLMRDDLLKIFCEEYTKHFNMLLHEQEAVLRRHIKQQGKLAKERASLIQALKDGIPANVVKDDLIRVTADLERLEKQIKARKKNSHKPFVHPSMARLYQEQIASLRALLDGSTASGEAAEHVRGLIEKIVLTRKPDQDELSIDLYGDLAGILAIAMEDKVMKKGDLANKPPENLIVNDNQAQWRSEIADFLVARGRFELPTPSL